MKSRASIKSHPVHPILISFPIALLYATLILDIIFTISQNPVFRQAAGYAELSGIISGLLAAIPGAIDYFYTVPPKSSAKKRASKHAVLNLAMLALFTAAFLFRDTANFNIVLALELAGILLMTIAGWMGGTLVHRNLIGVDMRYAQAGKWKEAYLTAEAGFVEVADKDELKSDQMKLVHVGNRRIAIARNGEQYVAFDDRCSHRGGSLAGGMMICGTVQCPWHGSQFDVTDGKVKAGPAKEKISCYPVIERDGKILLQIKTS